MYQVYQQAVPLGRRQQLLLRYGPALVRGLWFFPTLQRWLRGQWVKTRAATRYSEAVTLHCTSVHFAAAHEAEIATRHRIRLVFPPPNETRPEAIWCPHCDCRTLGERSCING